MFSFIGGFSGGSGTDLSKGDFIGNSTTFATLPLISSGLKTAVNGDWAVLTKEDGVNLAGLYIYDGTTYSFAFEFSAPTGDAGFLGVITNETEFNALNPINKDTIYVANDFLVGGLITFEAGEYYYNNGWLIKKLDTEIDYCGLNEFIHNLKPYTLSLAFEGTTTHNSIVRVNGSGATFDSFVGTINAANTGNGLVQFVTGAGDNGQYNERASTIETIRDVGEYIEVAAANVGQFNTLALQITDTKAFPANNAGGLRLTLNGGQNRWTLFNGPTQISTGQSEQATFRFTRTLYGFTVTRNGATLYTSPEVCNVYGEEEPIEISQDNNNGVELRADGLYSNIATVNGTSGYHRISLDKPANPINTSTAAAGTNIPTGHDLTQASGMTLKLLMRDQAGDRGWNIEEIDVDNMLQQFNAGNVVDAYVNTFSTGHVVVNIVNPSAGIINFRDVTRDMEYVKSELWITAEQSPSDRIGDFIHKNSSMFTDDATALSKGYLAVKPGTIANGAIDYPIWAAGNANFVSGNDIVFPTNVEGIILRNTGGNAGAEGDYQASQNLAHTHTYTRYAALPANSAQSGGGARWRGTSGQQTTSNGGSEARPVNRAYQLYTIVDSYTGSFTIPNTTTQPTTTTITANTTIVFSNANDYTVDASASALTITLPPAETSTTPKTLIFDVLNADNLITFVKDSADAVDVIAGNASFTASNDFDSITLVSKLGKYFIR